MAKKIVCNLPNRSTNTEEPFCTATLLHQVSPRMVQIGRQGRQKISIVGSNWSSLVTCPKCNREHSIICTSGVIDETNHKYEDIEPKPEGNPADPNDPNNPEQHETKQVAEDPAKEEPTDE